MGEIAKERKKTTMESFYAQTSSAMLGICTLVGWYFIHYWCGIIYEGIMGQGEEYTLVGPCS
jgi:hypothetical protein